ncbi:EpsG family protein [Aliifodinibius salipaludis]|nr:EpsG family protein [Aliifodinibius salipaludis]
MFQSNNKIGFYSAMLFLLWPLLALLSAFKNYRSSWAKNILWAFIAFYGFAFAIGAESEGADIARYVEKYQHLHGQQMTFAKALEYYSESGDIDVASTFISIVLSRFTDSQSILTLVYGIIFGYFFSRNMWFVLEHLKGNIRFTTALLFICFFLVIPIWNMNGFRMWTAAHIFIYGLLPYLYEGKKSGVLIASLSILVHFSFLVPVSILYLYIFAGNRLLIYFVFYCLTFFVSEINLSVFNELVEGYAPEIIQERTAGYRGEQYVENYREGTTNSQNWYMDWYGRAMRWSIMGFLVVLFFRAKKFFMQNKNWLNLFCFTLLFYGVANLFSSLPSGGRFLSIANLSALALITLYVQNKEHEKVMKRFIIAATPALVLFIVVSVRMGLYSISATTILGNPIIAIFLTGEHISMNDVMRMLL